MARIVPTMLILALVIAAPSGCGKALLSPKDERSQYDRYDRVRNDYAPQYVQDEYGRQLPNVRARLKPRD
ncbi:MAG: hypothetical protein JNK58_07260 [Phycisphaerae bacterium]|nr:hypothetical protein [Phycisphaerae bacterium]